MISPRYKWMNEWMTDRLCFVMSYLFLLLYSGLSCKRDLDLKETSWLSKGYNNNNRMKISDIFWSFILLVLTEVFPRVITSTALRPTAWRNSASPIATAQPYTVKSALNSFIKPNCFVLLFPYMCFACFPGSHNRVNQCPVNEHGCLDLDVCIHMSKVCDGVPDCSDGWDEGPHCRGKTHSQIC